jgi:hypothetical protein
MNLDTIKMDADEAAERAAAYEELPNPTDEERAIWQGFAALAAGKTLINLADAIRSGGCDERGWPRLAVMGADAKWCHLGVSPLNSGLTRWTFAPRVLAERQTDRLIHRFEVPTKDGETVKVGGWGWQNERRRAMVPNVPPELRPRGKGTWRNTPISLAHFLILWEVPEWEQAPVPPGDPALLRHLGGELYTVEAVWDLTELEQAVLAGRSRD